MTIAAKHNPFASNEPAVPKSATITIGTESGGNVINVAIQLKDQNGDDLAVRGSVMGYLSADANGDAIAAAVPTVAIGTDGLLTKCGGPATVAAATAAAGNSQANIDTVALDIVTKVNAALANASLQFMLTSEADGDIDINLTKTGAFTCYLVLIFPDGHREVSEAITFAA